MSHSEEYNEALATFIVISIISAAQAIFISAVYHNINGEQVKDFNQELAENLFVYKESKKFFYFRLPIHARRLLKKSVIKFQVKNCS